MAGGDGGAADEGWDFAPPHAYVPGRSPRHPEGLFDPVRDTVGPGMEVAALAASAAWRTGVRYMADGFHWEAHEVLEPVWMALPPASAEALAVRGAIQLANAALKVRMGRPRAARRLLAMSDALMAEAAARGGDARLRPSPALIARLRAEVQQSA